VAAAAGQDDSPESVSRQLDEAIAGHAFDRASAAFTDAAAAALAHDLDKARDFASEATAHLRMAEKALGGLRYVPYVAPSRRGRGN
jgi:hypothetical protein